MSFKGFLQCVPFHFTDGFVRFFFKFLDMYLYLFLFVLLVLHFIAYRQRTHGFGVYHGFPCVLFCSDVYTCFRCAWEKYFSYKDDECIIGKWNPRVVAHTCNPAQAAEAGGLPPCSTQWVPDQPWIYRVSQKKQPANKSAMSIGSSS